MMTLDRIDELQSRAPESAESVTLPGPEFSDLLEAARFGAESPFAIGSFVHAKVSPSALKSGRFAHGRVNAVESYTDDNGSRMWIYVRWLSVDGKPDAGDQKHAPAELEPV